jgi:glycosyltransferase involved in cell wall biosynthesis
LTTAVLVLGTADWRSAIETNQHHVTRILAGCFDDTTFVESQGLRRPRVTVADARRVARRLRRRLPADTPASEAQRIRIVSPRIPPVSLVPSVGHPLVGRLLRRQIGAWLTADRRVLWTYTPVTLGLEHLADQVVYHCVDLLAHQMGVPQRLVTATEARLAKLPSCRALASSTMVMASLERTGFADVTLLQNVADAELFSAQPRIRPPGRPRVVFAGRLTRSKIDKALLEQLAQSEDFELVLAGPAAPDWGPSPKGATVTGNLTAPELAKLLATASVGLVPYRATRYTEGVFPLKVFEYLAAGLAVVSTPMASMAHLDLPGVDVAADAGEFARLVDKHLDWPSDGDVAERRAAAAANSWSRRGDEIRAVVTEVLG